MLTCLQALKGFKWSNSEFKTDYVVSFCYRKIFKVKSNEYVRLCMDIFNCDDVDTLVV